MTPSPDIDPLGPDERELARILRALPAAEPPAALDATILRAAADASASRSQRRGGWLGAGGALWGISSAAAAVLALGIGWQALYGNHPAAGPASKPVSVEDSAETDAVSVEFKDHTSLADQARTAPAAPPPAETKAPALQRAPRPAGNTVAQAPAMPTVAAAPAPEPFPDSSLDEHAARRAEAVAADASATGALRGDRNAGAESAKAQAARQDSAVAGDVASLAVSAAPPSSAAATAIGGAAPAMRESARASTLRPATWLAQVRTLRDEGKLVEARAHLLEFRRMYPHWIIPTDLAPLLRE